MLKVLIIFKRFKVIMLDGFKSRRERRVFLGTWRERESAARGCVSAAHHIFYMREPNEFRVAELCLFIERGNKITSKLKRAGYL
jgi:hypothetical protein